MRKSSKIKFCLLSLPLTLVAVAAVGCGKDDHTHTYSKEWAFNAEAHWHPSACSHDTKANKSGHTYVQTVIPPGITSAGYTLNSCACGYSYTSDSVDSLPIESEGLRYNESGHWKSVLSGDEVEIEPHKYTDTTVGATCSASGYTKHACACGYWYASDITDPVAHTYDNGVWGHDKNGHWHSALCCGAKSGASAHDFAVSVTPATCDKGGYTEFACKDCGYTYRGRTTPASHSYANALTSDEYEHWRSATCEHSTEKTDAEEHALIGTSNVCEVCGKAVSPRLAYELSGNREYYIVTGIGCLNKNEIAIPDEYRGLPVREIAAGAFKDSEITSVAFGANVEKIGAEAFAGTKISVADMSGIGEIGTKAFANTKIAALALGESVQSIGYAAFRDCKDLATVQIKGNKLTVLSPFTFEGCSSLRSVTCETPLTEIGAQAFSDCAEITAVDLSACRSVGFAAFGGCSKFNNFTSLGKLSVAEEYAFSGCALQSVTLPATLKRIEDNLFHSCTKLTEVGLSATSVGNSAFEGCTALATVTLHGVELVGESAFKGCSALHSLTLPDTVVRVGEDAFTDTGLVQTENGVRYAANVLIGADGGTASVTVKADAVGIADGALRGNTTLNAVSLGGVRFIGVSAFRECENLTSVVFTETVKIIGANAFRESGLTSVTVPSTVQSVGDNAFYDCESLASVTVSAKKIGRFAFSYTGVNRTLNSPVKERPSYAKIKSLTIGSGVTEIGSNAFQYCPITSVTLPANLTSVGMYAFAQTDLSSITIPASVTRIGEYAFYGSKLSSATFADAENWRAGKKILTLSSASGNATYLKTTYADVDWIKEQQGDEA